MYTAREKILIEWGLICDLVSLNVAFGVGYFARLNAILALSDDTAYRTLLLLANVIYLLIHFIGFREVSLSKRNPLNSGLREASTILLAFAFSYFVAIVFIQGYIYSRAFHIVFLAAFAIIFPLQRILVFPIIQDMIMKSGRKIKVVLVGADKSGRLYYDKLQEMNQYYDVVAVLDDNLKNGKYFNGQFKGSTEGLESILTANRVDEVVVSIPPSSKRKIRNITETADRHYSMVKMIPRYPDALTWRKVETEDFDGMLLFTMPQSRLLLLKYQLSKRIFDIVFSSIVLLTVFPALTFVIGPLIRLGSKGSVFFSQKRRGYRGEEFDCLKYRTMKVQDKASEVKQASAHDPRKTKLGEYLRKTSLDELPQFWNVLRGEMSVVGPRPHMVEHDEIYNRLIRNYYVRLFGKPGLTGWAQIHGFRGSTEDPELMRRRVEHDIWYLENWSMWLDVKIMFLTVGRILKGDPNAY